MVDLKCNKQDCKFNDSCNCMAKGIDVSEKTICTTYEKSPEKNKREEDKIKRTLIRHNTCVRCCADCIFQDKNICMANGITVIDSVDEQTPKVLKEKSKQIPSCFTYLPK